MAKPKLCLIPATIGDKVYSILPSDGVGDFDFTRGTVATRINAQGLIEQVASGENRLNYSLLDGEVVGCPHLLLEPQRTNLFPYSEDFSQWSKTGSTSVSSNDNISPDGTLNASTVSGLTGSGGNDLYLITGQNPASKTYSLSVYLKGEGILRLQMSNNVNQGISENVTLTSDWKRHTVTGTFNSTLGTLSATLDDSGATATEYKVWGAMLEEGSYPTSYIKTTSAAVTRAAETCNGSGNAATFNDSEGVLMAEISALADDGTNRRISISNGSTSDRVVLGYTGASNQLIVLVSSNSVSGVASLVNIDNSLQFNKIALKYKLNDFALWINGIEILTDNSLNSPIGLNDLSFEGADNLNDFYGNTKQIQYFDSVLDSEQLEQLTSWDSFRAMAEGQQYNIE